MYSKCHGKLLRVLNKVWLVLFSKATLASEWVVGLDEDKRSREMS